MPPANFPADVRVSHAGRAFKPRRRCECQTGKKIIMTSKTTTDHSTIRHWAEERGAVPSSVEGTEQGGEEAGILRFDFKPKDEGLEPIDWDAFFDKFEKSELAFLYQDETAAGKVSRFHKFVARH
jgi:hypothetical protein